MLRGVQGFALVVTMMWAFPVGAQEEVSTSTASSSAAATEYADAGRLFYQNGQYVEALEAFQNAYALTPTAALTFNIARCYEKLSQWSDAISFYEKYLELETNPRDRSEVLDKLELLKKRVGADPKSPEAQFDARMEAGRKAYGRGDYEAAISSFLSALELKQDADAVYNIAKSYERLARYEEAIDFFEQYLQLSPEASDKADVEATITRLRKAIKERFQDLSVSSVPPGADIFLDDVSQGQIGQTNFTTKVTPGPHKLFLELNGYEPVEREFVMPDDKPLSLEFQLKELENVGELS
ncbi:MAG: tetratricopeptide repeat protein, partial [Myxococcota bacterium]